MLQSTRDSPGLEYIGRLVSRAEEWAWRNKDPVVEFLESSSGELVFIYNRLGYIAASILYWIITTLNPSKQPVIQDSDTIAYYRLVYREPSTIVYFTTTGNDPALIRLCDAARLTGSNVLLITPPPPEPVSSMLRDTRVLEIPYMKEEVLTALTESLLALYVGVEAYGLKGFRIDRLRENAREGFREILGELYSKYGEALNQLCRADTITITSTRFLEPAGYVFVEVFREVGKNASYIPVSLLKPRRGEKILLLANSVEEHLVREKKMKALLSGAQVIDIVMNTDPLESPIYLILLAIRLLH